MSIALKIDSLIKSYGNNKVIKDISFYVNHGEIFGLLGTNGAGKTTTLECIEGIRSYDSGNIMLDGKIGVQLQSSSLPQTIKVIEAINLFCKWNKAFMDNRLIDILGLNELKNKQYKDMSTGQKRRLHLTLALIGNPDIIFLDEPTAGLDVEGRVSLHDEIRKLKKQGKTIIIASHDMAEVESLCDRIAILKNGNIAFYGTASELTQQMGIESLIYIKASRILKMKESKNYKYEGEKQGYSIFHTKSIADALIELLFVAKSQQISVHDIKIERATLEQGFMDIAKEDGE